MGEEGSVSMKISIFREMFRYNFIECRVLKEQQRYKIWIKRNGRHEKCVNNIIYIRISRCIANVSKKFLEIYVVRGSMEVYIYIEVSCIFPVIDILSREKESLQWKIWKRFLHLIFHQTSWFHAYFIQHKGNASQRERVYIYLSMDNSLRSRFIEKLFFPTGFEYIIVPFDRRNSSSENIVAFVKIVEIRLCILSKMKYDSRCIHYLYFVSSY